MAPIVWLASLLSMVLFQPLLVNNPADENGMNSEFVFDPEDLDFIEYEDVSLMRIIPVKHVVTVPLVMLLTVVAVCQIRILWREQKEIQRMFEQFSFDHEETELLFSELERKSRSASNRFNKIEKRTKNNKEFDNIKEDVDFLTTSWNGQFSSFSLLDIDVTNKTHESIEEISGELSTIRESFEREFASLKGYLEEDCLSLIDVSRDVQMLERCFGK